MPTMRRIFAITLLLGTIQLGLYASALAQESPSGDRAADISKQTPEKFETIHNDFYWVDQNGAS